MAAGVIWLFAWKRPQERAINDFSSRIQTLIEAGSTSEGIALTAEPGALGKLGVAVNKLIDDLQQRGAQWQNREQLFQRLVETVHDAVLVHRKTILFANASFLSLL